GGGRGRARRRPAPHPRAAGAPPRRGGRGAVAGGPRPARGGLRVPGGGRGGGEGAGGATGRGGRHPRPVPPHRVDYPGSTFGRVSTKLTWRKPTLSRNPLMARWADSLARSWRRRSAMVSRSKESFAACSNCAVCCESRLESITSV